MVRKERKRISYVLPLANSAGGHRLGVNGLAVDPNNSILYSGGRDGVICAWDLNLDLNPFSDQEQLDSVPSAESAPKPTPTIFRQQVQAHTHWINDIVLAQGNEALVSASSDITVKIWRPAAQDIIPPQTIGLHSDYVKCLASPGPQANWVASGGLDRKVCLWDLNGGGQQLKIAVGEDENTAKGSVYALAVTGSILASGGPDSVVRVWDPRSGKRITKFVGHTDNIRDVLIAQDCEMLMTASSDQTVKVWSMIAGRCMYTLTMHNDSVWSLYSDHPRLSVFYSSDRSGLVAKTDTRGCDEMDEGLSVALCQEHEGVNKVISAGDYVWTATSSSSINRWNDVDTTADVQAPEPFQFHRASTTTLRPRYPSISLSQTQSHTSTTNNAPSNKQIPYRSVLRMSNTAPFPMYPNRGADTATLHSIPSMRKASDAFLDVEAGPLVPYRGLPDYSIEGQNGLIKHHLLADRRRVLTLDTAGEVMMWDLLQCAPIKSFGKRHLEDVVPEVNTQESVAHWCTVDTRTGSLTCILEENYCFDAEMYADELVLDEKIEFREDQRINLGKWILRYLFSNLIDEEIKRDEMFRQQLMNEYKRTLQRSNAPTSIQLPQMDMNGWNENGGPTSASTLRASNGFHPMTPGMSIGLATPATLSSVHSTLPVSRLSPTAEEGAQLEKTVTQQSHSRSSSGRADDYFSAAPRSAPPPAMLGTAAGGKVVASGEIADSTMPQSPSEADKETSAKEGGALFSKKFRMNMSFGMKKLGRTSTTESNKPVIAEQKVEDSEDSASTKTEDRVVENNFYGMLQSIRLKYEDELQAGATALTSAFTPSLPNETPVLKPPLSTTILIQEDQPDSGGVADLFEGTVATLGQQADLIERAAPKWLGEVLLLNTIPQKEIVKVAFILEPFEGSLPPIATDGNNRLNANRMLRARKILSYIADRVEPQPEHPDPNALRPEEYLELYCKNELVPPTMTLATIRAHVWKTGGDVMLYYKANGRKEIRHAPAPASGPSSAPASDGKRSTEGESPPARPP